MATQWGSIMVIYIYNGFWELYYEYHSVIMMRTEDNETILVLMI